MNYYANENILSNLRLSSYLVITFYLLDALIKRYFNFYVGAFFFIPLIIFFASNFFKNKSINQYQLIIFICFIFITFVQYLVNAKCFNLKSTLSLGLLFFIFFNAYKLKILFEYILLKYSKYILFAILFSVILITIDIHIHGIFFGKNQFGGLYNEPSHLTLYVTPFITFRLLNNKFDILSIITIIAILVLSNSFLFFIYLFILTFLIYKKFYLITLLILFSLFLIEFQYVINLLSQITYENNKLLGRYVERIIGLFELNNLTSLVYLHGINITYDNFILGKGIGLGFNNMGCYAGEIFSDYETKIRLYYNTVKPIHHQDGSFLASKIISDFGLIGISMLIYFTIKFLSLLKNSIVNFKKENIFLIAVSITLFLSIFLRSTSYFTAFNVFCLCGFFQTRVKI